MTDTAIVFDDWEAVLQAEVSPELRRPYREAIVKFRYWLRESEKPAPAIAQPEEPRPPVKIPAAQAEPASASAKHYPTGVGIRSPFDTL